MEYAPILHIADHSTNQVIGMPVTSDFVLRQNPFVSLRWWGGLTQDQARSEWKEESQKATSGAGSCDYRIYPFSQTSWMIEITAAKSGSPWQHFLASKYQYTFEPYSHESDHISSIFHRSQIIPFDFTENHWNEITIPSKDCKSYFRVWAYQKWICRLSGHMQRTPIFGASSSKHLKWADLSVKQRARPEPRGGTGWRFISNEGPAVAGKRQNQDQLSFPIAPQVRPVIFWICNIILIWNKSSFLHLGLM
jgi:hypothetical protein